MAMNTPCRPVAEPTPLSMLFGWITITSLSFAVTTAPSRGAALLVDHVLPAVGYRQWVLSFPGPMAVRLGYDAPPRRRRHRSA